MREPRQFRDGINAGDDQQAITEVTDAYGNVTEIKAKKTLTKKEIKKMTKEIKAKIKSGTENGVFCGFPSLACVVSVSR